jgi:lysophospholipase L1-like esterase
MAPDPAPHAEFTAAGRVTAPWTRVFGLGVAAFLLWLLLFAPTLQHNAQTSPIGTRRSVALSILRPIASVSRALQLSRLVSATDEATGRTGNRLGSGSGITVLGPHHHPLGPSPSGPALGPPRPGTTSTTLPYPLSPTAAHPLRVLIVGDSIGIDVGGPLQNDLSNSGVATAVLDARESTGLTRPDYFNWPAELQTDLKAYTPQIVVIMIGANDPQDFLGPPDVPYGSARWNDMYAQRVDTFMQIAQSTGAAVIWVGMPPMQSGQRTDEMSDVNAVVQQEAVKQHPPIDYLSTWTLLGTAQGTYTPFVTTAGGQVLNIRTPDGTHLTPAGGELVSQSVINYLRGTLHIAVP